MAFLQSVWGLAVLMGAGLVVYLGGLTCSTLWMLRRPPRRTYGWAVARGVPGDPSELDGGGRAYESWVFDRARLSLPVWDIPGDEPAGPVVVVTHGWGSSRADMLPRVSALIPHASRVVMWDMPGHGDAPGRCRLSARERDDLVSLIEVLLEGGVDQAGVVLYGYSLGAEVSLLAANGLRERSLPVGGLILEAPYRHGITPARNVHRLAGSPSLVNVPVSMALIGLLEGLGMGWRWQDLSLLANDATPTLVLHGANDRVSPPEDGREIARAAGGRFHEIPGATHNDIWSRVDATQPSSLEHDPRVVLARYFEEFDDALSRA